MTTQRHEADVQNILKHVGEALGLINRYDDGGVTGSGKSVGPGSFKSEITAITPTSYRVRIVDAHPARSGRPEFGEPRFYTLNVTIQLETTPSQ